MAGDLHARFQPCFILRENSIPCVVWGEDAIGYYGVPTVVFSFYVLVTDIDEAKIALVQRGWKLEDESQSKFGNGPLRSAHHRLTPPHDPTQYTDSWVPGSGPPPPPSQDPPGPTTTILLPASEWNFTLPACNESEDSFFPPLPELLDSLINKQLDNPHPDSWFVTQVAVLISYLYGHVPALKDKSFAEQLQYEHRQYHYDSLSGMSTGTLPFIRHQRRIRDELRNGTCQLCDCSADRNDESLFNAGIQARILASMQSPFSAEDYERG